VRQHLESRTRGGFHWHDNHLPDVGDACDLHAHAYDHLVVCDRPLRIEADGAAIEVPAWSFPVIAAGVAHRIVAVEPNTRFRCLFACWQPGPDGVPMWLADPKVEAARG
jgi:hypothetical protein